MAGILACALFVGNVRYSGALAAILSCACLGVFVFLGADTDHRVFFGLAIAATLPYLCELERSGKMRVPAFFCLGWRHFIRSVSGSRSCALGHIKGLRAGKHGMGNCSHTLGRGQRSCWRCFLSILGKAVNAVGKAALASASCCEIPMTARI